MSCKFSAYKTEIKTYYVGKTGIEYSVDSYVNIGEGEKRGNKINLPLNEYPYTIKHKEEYKWKCCIEGTCDNKE